MKLKLRGFVVDVPKVIFHRELFKVVSTDAWVIEFSIIGPRIFMKKCIEYSE